MSAAAGRTGTLPLCVDLDGTLVATDTGWESVLSLLRTRPWLLLAAPGQLLRGLPQLKIWLAENGPVDPAALPYRDAVVRYVEEARAAGREAVLATASTRAIGEAVAGEVGCFDRVIASDGRENLKGGAKLRALEAEFGPRGFEYVGDSSADLAVWAGAGAASTVGLSPAEQARVAALAPAARHFDKAEAGPVAWLQAMRVHQWVKNLLVFLPLFASHRVAEPPLILASVLAFACFSLAASAVYLGNDLMDLPSDRAHPTKCRRPFAAGLLPISHGIAAAIGCAALALGLAAALLPPAFLAVLATYLVVNVLYTLRLKRIAIADVVFLACLYAGRILAGGAATEIPISPWLAGFSLFFFLNLALVKRYAEVRILAVEGLRDAPGRAYATSDAPLLLALGPAAGYMATVVLALYIQGDYVLLLYRSPEVLWGLIPLLLYWVGRMWWVAHHGRMPSDPIVFTTRDAPSYVVLAGALAVFAAATFLGPHS